MARETGGREDMWEDVPTTFVADLPPLSTPLRDKACLVVLAGGRIGEMVAIGEGITIGRSTDAGFCIPANDVSRIHSRLERTSDGAIRIVDEASCNGTFVNGRRVDSAVLNDGDKIYIGTRAILRFSYADRLEEEFQRRMYEATLRDSLTGLFNRRHLMSQLDTEFHFVARLNTPLTVVLIDIDHFKAINDGYGHLVGDAVLMGFGKRLAAWIRNVDFAARYGGEEFVIRCLGTPTEGGVFLAKRLQQKLRQCELVRDIPELRVTFSAGVAGAPHPQVQGARDLLRLADEALYRAKESGRDRVCSVADREQA